MLELSLNLGDGRGQAAAAGAFGLTTSIPSVNLTLRIIFGNWLWPSRRRQFFSAASASLKIMASAVLFERHPLERTVRWRTVANELSMGSAFADAVTHARAPHRDCTDAGHDLALGQMPVAHQSPAAIIGQLVGMGAEPSRNLGFDGLPQ